MCATADIKLDRHSLIARFRRVRQQSLDMVAPLPPEAYRLQPIADVSPPWWNLAHTTWFFARNVVRAFGGMEAPEDELYDYLLNSYYESLGPRLPREKRGSVTRPSTDEVFAYRASVDRRIEELVRSISDERADELTKVLEIGIQHEQQHQELFFTEIKYILAQNPPRLRTPYQPQSRPHVDDFTTNEQLLTFHEFDGGLFSFGHHGAAWCWDNEGPVHKYYLQPYSLADRLVTCGDYQRFIDDGGYQNPLLWLDNGWQQLKREGWQAPLYWECEASERQQWTLNGQRSVDPLEPVCHVSFYEADAYSRWASETFSELQNVRLPSEREWEHAARTAPCVDSVDAFLDAGVLHPWPSTVSSYDSFQQMFGCLWQWTSSYYEPYPGYEPFPGVLAEYNGKFMDNQRVLRGGSCVTPRDHFRLTYRNFWSASTRFQFTGIRLARSL